MPAESTLEKELDERTPQVGKLSKNDQIISELLEIRTNEFSTQSFSIKSSRYISRDVKRIVLKRSGN